MIIYDAYLHISVEAQSIICGSGDTAEIVNITGNVCKLRYFICN